MADQSVESLLLEALNDKDPVVAQRSARALTSLWQQSRSPSVSRLLSQGLAAYEAGNFTVALDQFNMSQRLDTGVPDLYRLRAEILLDQGEAGKALNDCQTAVDLKPENFMAHYVQARCYRELSDLNAAMASVNKALEIYGGFGEAYHLKVEIISSLQSLEGP